MLFGTSTFGARMLKVMGFRSNRRIEHLVSNATDLMAKG